jgi:hypothetical protein
MDSPLVGLEEETAGSIDQEGGVLKKVRQDQGEGEVLHHDRDETSKVADGLKGMAKGSQPAKAIELAGLRSVKLGCATRGVGHQESSHFLFSFEYGSKGRPVGGKQVWRRPRAPLAPMWVVLISFLDRKPKILI